MKKSSFIFLVFISFVVLAGMALSARSLLLAFTGPNCAAGNCAGAIAVDSANNVSIGGATPDSASTLLITASTTGTTRNALKVTKAGNASIFIVRDDGHIGFSTTTLNDTLNLFGGMTLTGSLTGSGSGQSITGFSMTGANVSSAAFGANTGGGNYSFPASLSINGTTMPTGSNKLFVNGGIDVNSNKITNLATPTDDADAATKAYVDAAGGGVGSGKTYKKQLFMTSGTWTSPGKSIVVSVTCIGGGGGGGGVDTSYASGHVSGADGGTSSFGALCSANGGTSGEAGPGAGYNAGARAFGGTFTGTTVSAILPATGGAGGKGFMGIGSGGSGGVAEYVPNATSHTDANSGGGSGYVSTYNGTVSSNQTVTIGGGGSAGTNASPGSSGAVIVEWWE